MGSTKYVGEQLEWLEKIAEGRDMSMTIGDLLAELRETDRAYWAHEAMVESDVAGYLAGMLAEAEGVTDVLAAGTRAVEIERTAREKLHPTGKRDVMTLRVSEIEAEAERLGIQPSELLVRAR
jgi:hypothetical protein